MLTNITLLCVSSDSNGGFVMAITKTKVFQICFLLLGIGICYSPSLGFDGSLVGDLEGKYTQQCCRIEKFSIYKKLINNSSILVDNVLQDDDLWKRQNKEEFSLSSIQENF